MIDDVVSLATKLIKLKTISRNYREMCQCANFLNSYAKSNNLYYEYHDNGNNPVLIISNGEKKNFDIMSLGHIDVVPGSDKLFTPTITNDILKGRGSFD